MAGRKLTGAIGSLACPGRKSQAAQDIVAKSLSGAFRPEHGNLPPGQSLSHGVRTTLGIEEPKNQRIGRKDRAKTGRQAEKLQLQKAKFSVVYVSI
jgi:hypothetical protein